jgi:pimeloyl-ACP methyl ester carboxylesterase
MTNKKLKRQWVWFRGLIRWKIHWGDFEAEFRKHFPDDEIQMIDFPGFGDYHHLKSPLAIEEMLDHIDRSVKGEGPFYVLAYSLGAMVAAQWSNRHPQKIKQQFLMNTSDQRSPFFKRLRPKQWPLLFSRLLLTEAEFVESGILDVISNRPESKARYLSRFVQSFKKVPVSRSNLLRQLSLATKIHFPEKAPVPTVILTSLGDRLVHHSCSEKIAKMWNLQPHIHGSAGHDISLDDSDWVIQKIEQFLI